MNTTAEDLRPEASDAALDTRYAALVRTNRQPRAPAMEQEPGSAFTGGAVHHFLPHGIDDLVPNAAFTKDADGGWTWGNHPSMSTQQTQHLQDTVHATKHAFAHSNTELPGYHGVEGPIRKPVRPGT